MVNPEKNNNSTEPLERNGFLTRTGVLAKLSEGWQLGTSNGARTSRAWMQLKLCCGGDSFKVRMQTVLSMLARGQIVMVPITKDDRWWLTRYVIKSSTES